jgi:hypothetical protein
MFVKFCADCKWSKTVDNSSWELRCMNPYINKDDSWALGKLNHNGSDCQSERAKKGIIGFFSECGVKGKRWEQKDNAE